MTLTGYILQWDRPEGMLKLHVVQKPWPCIDLVVHSSGKLERHSVQLTKELVEVLEPRCKKAEELLARW